MKKNSILIIDDDVELCELLGDYLKPEGFHTECHNKGKLAAEKARSGKFDLVILDVMLPGRNGFEVLRRIRELSQIPVIMLTARGNEVDRIIGLEMGADDYLPKPFNPRELVARIRAVQRRFETRETSVARLRSKTKNLAVGDVSLDMGTRVVRRAGQTIELTSVEFSLLEALLRQAGEVVPRDELVQSVLGRRLSPYDRSIDVHISNLRRKLGRHLDQSERIKTIRGTGYQYTAEWREDSPAV